MNYSQWRLWVKSRPVGLRWFVYLVLLRPIIDNFYGLKEVSPFLSPLYMVGVLTPVAILASYNSRGFPRKFRSPNDGPFMGWGVAVFFNAMLILVVYFSLGIMGNIIKYITPPLLFFYLRHFIQSRQDLHGILQTFLYSTVVPIVLIPYHYFFNTRAFRQMGAGRGGGTRFAGGYADVMSYAILIVGAFLVLAYFLLENHYTGRRRKNLGRMFYMIIPGCVVALAAIKHTSSWAVFIMLAGLFFFYIVRRKRGIAPVLIFLLGLGAFAGDFFKAQIDPLIAKEVRVLEGEAEVDRSFNGRMKRWKRVFGIWEKMPAEAWIFGVALAAYDEGQVMVDGRYHQGFNHVIPVFISSGMHNDYIRILFLSGMVGLFFYLLFILSIFRARKKLTRVDRFLVLGALLIVCMYSITTCPTLYVSLLYVVLPVFAYASLPRQVLYRDLSKVNEKKDLITG